NTSKSIDNLIKVGANYTILPGLNADLNYQYERSTVNMPFYYSVDSYYARNLINQFTQPLGPGRFTYPVPVGGILQQSDAYLTSQQARAQLNYNKNFGE